MVSENFHIHACWLFVFVQPVLYLATPIICYGILYYSSQGTSLPNLTEGFNYAMPAFCLAAVATFSLFLYITLRMFFLTLWFSTNATNTHRVPPNVRFEVDDVEAEWTFNQKFDYIHCRFMGNAIRDWPHLVDQCFQ